MNTPFLIRPMIEADLPQVHTVELLAHPAPWSLNLLQEEWKKQRYHFAFVAENPDDHRITGYSFCWGWEGVDMTISNIAVHSDFRRQGVATRLMKRMIETARHQRCISVILEVRESNTPAKRLYSNLGFTVVGKRPDYYLSPKEDGWIMRLQPVNAGISVPPKVSNHSNPRGLD